MHAIAAGAELPAQAGLIDEHTDRGGRPQADRRLDERAVRFALGRGAGREQQRHMFGQIGRQVRCEFVFGAERQRGGDACLGAGPEHVGQGRFERSALPGAELVAVGQHRHRESLRRQGAQQLAKVHLVQRQFDLPRGAAGTPQGPGRQRQARQDHQAGERQRVQVNPARRTLAGAAFGPAQPGQGRHIGQADATHGRGRPEHGAEQRMHLGRAQERAVPTGSVVEHQTTQVHRRHDAQGQQRRTGVHQRDCATLLQRARQHRPLNQEAAMDRSRHGTSVPTERSQVRRRQAFGDGGEPARRPMLRAAGSARLGALQRRHAQRRIDDQIPAQQQQRQQGLRQQVHAMQCREHVAGHANGVGDCEQQRGPRASAARGPIDDMTPSRLAPGQPAQAQLRAPNEEGWRTGLLTDFPARGGAGPGRVGLRPRGCSLPDIGSLDGSQQQHLAEVGFVHRLMGGGWLRQRAGGRSTLAPDRSDCAAGRSGSRAAGSRHASDPKSVQNHLDCVQLNCELHWRPCAPACPSANAASRPRPRRGWRSTGSCALRCIRPRWR